MAQPHEIDQKIRDAYWKDTMRITWIILVLWFVSWVGPLVFHSALNRIVLFGFPLSFWFEAQGSLAFFILLIVWYAVHMNRLDRKHGLQEDKA